MKAKNYSKIAHSYAFQRYKILIKSEPNTVTSKTVTEGKSIPIKPNVKVRVAMPKRCVSHLPPTTPKQHHTLSPRSKITFKTVSN
jgi:hypothetical protein